MKTLGLDIGTTSISSVIYEERAGVLEAQTLENGTFLPSNGWERLQDPAAIWQKASTLTQTLLKRHPDVGAIGVTGQMHGIVYLDSRGEAVSPLYTWQDGRGDLPYDDTGSWADRLSGITGYPLPTGYGMVTHFYNLRNGLVPKNAAALCTIGDYIAMISPSSRQVPCKDVHDYHPVPQNREWHHTRNWSLHNNKVYHHG